MYNNLLNTPFIKAGRFAPLHDLPLPNNFFMKKITLFIAACILFFYAKPQSVSGNWEGTLNIQGTELPIVFHIKKDSSNKLTATFDSPKQNAYNLPCSDVIAKDDSLILMMKMLNGRYEGLLSTDKKTATGKWFQGANNLPLDLKKTSDVVTTKEFKRPQTPKPPFSYASEDVSYFNADKSIQFGATFTYPSKTTGKKYPTVILLTGSGQQDRDETIFEHKSFAVIADYLTRQGIAVLRVDDRGKGKTTGDFSTSTSADFALDAAAGINYLKSRRETDTLNLGIIGHSEGGMIAPIVAAKRKDIKFIVLLAGPAIPIINLMEQQSVDVAASTGVNATDLELYRPLYKNMVMSIIKEKDTAIAKKNATYVFNYWQNKTTPAVIKNTTGVMDEKSKAAFIAVFVKQLQQPWFKYFMQFNPEDYLSEVHCAVLALNGEKDIQVAAKANLAAIKKAIPTASIKSMPGLNHLFQHCVKCSVDEYAELEETFSPEVLQIITEWIKETTGKKT